MGQPYDERLSRLLAHRIGLWDVLGACERAGSLDSAIRKPAANDFERLRALCPLLETVGFNGQTAGKFAPQFALAGYQTVVLPSTSPAHASFSFEQKLARWRSLMRRIEQASRIYSSFVQQTDVVAPKYMPVERAHGPQQRRHSGWISRGVRIASVTNNAQCAVFGDGAGGPSAQPILREPIMRNVVLDVARVNQCDQDIYVKQVRHPGSSSRNLFTISKVTGMVPGCVWSSGTPLRVA